MASSARGAAAPASGRSAAPALSSPHSPRSRLWVTDLSLLLMALIWGVNFSVVKYGTSLVAPLAYNALRLALAAVALIAICLALGQRWPGRRDALALVALGTLGNGIYQVLFVEGVTRTRAGDAALVVAASPAFIALIGRLRGTERTSARGVIGIALSILGIGLVVFSRPGGETGSGSALLGDFLVLCGTVCWSLYSVLAKPYTHRVGGLQLSALTMVGGAVPLLALAAPEIGAMQWSHVPPGAWAAIAYSGLGSLVIAYLFWYRGIRVIGPTRTAMYSNLQPLIAVGVAAAFLGESVTVWQVAGGTAIVGGLALTRSR